MIEDVGCDCIIPDHCLSFYFSIKSRVCCFQTLDAVFRKDLISDYLEITTAVVVPCGGPKQSPRTSIQCYFFVLFFVVLFSDPLGL